MNDPLDSDPAVIMACVERMTSWVRHPPQSDTVLQFSCHSASLFTAEPTSSCRGEGDSFPGEGRAWVTPATQPLTFAVTPTPGQVTVIVLAPTSLGRYCGDSRPHPPICAKCEADPHSHCLFPTGLDDRRRLVINDAENSVTHIVHTLHAWRFTAPTVVHTHGRLPKSPVDYILMCAILYHNLFLSTFFAF
jgi:hypothetical protein